MVAQPPEPRYGREAPSSPGGIVRPVQAADEREVVRFLRARPADNAYLLGHIARGGREEAQGGTLVGWWERGRLAGVALLGSNLVLSHGVTAAGVHALADAAAASDWVIKVVVGPDEIVHAFREALALRPERVHLERAAQVLLQVDRDTLRRDARSVELRPAQPSECDRLMAIDLEMVREELGIDPFSYEIEAFQRSWERRIAEWRAWVVGPIGGAIACKVDQAAVAPEVVQLAGVYTVPARRRQGLGRRAVGEMCHLLLREVPRVALYVNRDNAAALALYRGLGFYEVGCVRSVWLTAV